MNFSRDIKIVTKSVEFSWFLPIDDQEVVVVESVETKHENGKVNDEKYYVESSMVGSSFEGYA